MSDSFRAGLATAVFSFITLFGASLLGWLNDVVEWASADGATVAFPDGSVLVKAGVSAAVSALIGLVNWVIRYGQDRTGVGPATPDYTPPAT
jgi:hypothetical protein